MTMNAPCNAIPYDQDDRFRDLEPLICELEAKWSEERANATHDYFPDAIAEALWEREQVERFERQCPE